MKWSLKLLCLWGLFSLDLSAENAFAPVYVTQFRQIVASPGLADVSEKRYLPGIILSFRPSDPASKIFEDANKHLLYPNPAKTFVYVGFYSSIEGAADVQLFNMEGQLIKQLTIKLTKGFNQPRIAVNDIKEGLYFIRINKGELNIVRKLVITR